MRAIVALLLALHGIAHLVGFRASFWPSPLRVRKPSYVGGKVEGVVWLLLALGFLGSALLLLVQRESWTALLLLSTTVSLVMCVRAWPDARLGLLLDVVLLVLTLLLAPQRGSYLAAAFQREVSAALPPTHPAPAGVIDEAAVAGLPAPVRSYLKFMAVVGRPRDWSLRASFQARFRRASGPWANCEAVQYDTRLPVTRIFMLQMAMNGVLPVTVRDKYVGGRGTLEAKVFDWFAVAQGQGYELDVGELVTYLNDALLLAPSMLLGPETSWKLVDERSFDVTLRDGATSVTGRVWLDERGALVDFSTKDRFFDAPNGKRVRTEWRTPVQGWQDVGGRKLPTRAQAVWQLPDGPFPYADFSFDPARIAFNVSPL